jgi:hypothetical protein
MFVTANVSHQQHDWQIWILGGRTRRPAFIPRPGTCRRGALTVMCSRLTRMKDATLQGVYFVIRCDLAPTSSLISSPGSRLPTQGLQCA